MGGKGGSGLAGERRTGALGLEELGVGAGGVLGTEDALRRAKNARKAMRQTVSFFFREKRGKLTLPGDSV